MIQRQRTEIYSRIVGYIRPIRQWNPGKISEWKDREFFDITKGKAQGKNLKGDDNVTRKKCRSNSQA